MPAVRARAFNANCKRCPRLVKHLRATKKDHPDFFCQPVAIYGPESAKLLIVGLAPGQKGANRTGYPFTGDASGEWLYKALYKHGFAVSDDASGLHPPELINCRITNAVKCLPPGNSPTSEELSNCLGFLKREVSQLEKSGVIFALGSVAHKTILKTRSLSAKEFPFKHGARYMIANNLYLVCSYHCSKYNTQTKRLTWEMFDQVISLLKNTVEITDSTAAQ